MNPCFFVLWISSHLISHPVLLFQFYLVFHWKILFNPQCTDTEPCCTEHLIEGLVMREGSHIKERKQLKLAVRQHVGGIHRPPLKAVTQPPLLAAACRGPCSFLSSVQGLRLGQGLTIENPQVLLCCEIEKCQSHPFFDTSQHVESWYLDFQSAKS